MNVLAEMKKRNEVYRPPEISFCLMIFFVLGIVALNIHQILRLEEINRDSTISTSTSHAKTRRSLYDDNSPAKPPLRIAIPSRKGVQKNLVKPGDYIYFQDENMPRWDAAPIVIEKYKLLFFTVPKVGCTVWKQLFRRIMGYPDWKTQDYEKFIPHNPDTNGLRYLYHYPLKEASEMMTSPEWTRAIMVRDPKQRFLSAFLDKAVSNDHLHILKRCCPDGSCIEGAQTIEGFLKLCGVCEDEHWRAQHKRMESKYWPYMDMVLHVETAEQDAQLLLKKIGAWEQYGQSGWGSDDSLAIFASKEVSGAGEHATWSQYKHWQWYTPETELKVETFFRVDYENPLFNFTPGQCLTCSSQ